MLDEESIKTRERDFHDARFGADVDPRSHLDKYYSVTAEAKNYYRQLIAASARRGGRVLEYGCGAVDEIDFYKGLKQDFFGIDISAEAIRRATAAAQQAGFRATYLVADAERTEFAAGSFGTIFGSGILHHLDTERAARELSRLTAADGSCVFFEPMGHNFIVNVFRRLTPRLRTPDEHPLLESDFQVMRKHFGCVEVRYFCLASLLAVLLRGTPAFAKMSQALSRLDSAMFRRSDWIGRQSWICVLQLSKPVAY